MIVVAFVAAAAAGTLLRAAVSSPRHSFERHVWTTFGLNVAGSFALGWAHGSDAGVLVVFGVGGLGSLTTFSTFVWQVERLARRGRTVSAALFALVAISAGVGAAAVGTSL